MAIFQINENIFKKFKVKLAYLFGSQVKGYPGEQSDFDIAVLFFDDKKLTPALLFEKSMYLKEDLKQCFPADIDIVALNDADSLLKYEVISSGNCLFAENESFRINFEVLSIKEYIDDQYVRDIYTQELITRVGRGAF